MQMDHHRRSRALVAATLAAALAAALVPGIAAADSHVTVVAGGLNNPRGIAIAPNGQIFVAEAGTGGAGPCIDGPEGPACFGTTGAIARVRPGSVTRVVTGLPSQAGPDGSGATGPHKLSFQGQGNLFVTIGLGGNLATRAEFGNAGARLGTLVRVSVANGKVWRAADLTAYEETNDPDGAGADSNPYGVLATARGVYSTDAGGNDLLFTNRNGRTRTVAVFPDTMVEAPPFLGMPPGSEIPMQFVPTGVARGADGALYVSQLTGFPFPVGGSQIWKVRPGQAPEALPTDPDFTNVVDIAADRAGNLYVVEIAKDGLMSVFAGGQPPFGRLVKVAPDGTQTVLLDGPDFLAPGGVAVAADGSVYVTAGSIFPGGGQLLRIQP